MPQVVAQPVNMIFDMLQNTQKIKNYRLDIVLFCFQLNNLKKEIKETSKQVDLIQAQNTEYKCGCTQNRLAFRSLQSLKRLSSFHNLYLYFFFVDFIVNSTTNIQQVLRNC